MTFKLKEVEGCVRNNIPSPNENILTDFDLLDIKKIERVDIYYRPPEACPYARGNWIIDINFTDCIFCIKLPKEMTEEQVMEYAKPLLDKMKH